MINQNHVKKILLVLLILSSVQLCQALEAEFTQQIDDESFEAIYIEEGMVDGNSWMNFDRSTKWGYLFGFEDGVRGTAIHYVSDVRVKSKIQKSLPSSFEGGGDFEYLVQEVDKFYSDDRNIDIPINYVFLVIRNRLIGIDDAKIRRYIEYLRNPKGKDLPLIIDAETDK